MKSFIISFFILSTSAFAGTLPTKIYDALGNYDSKHAQHSDSYVANELSNFNVIITPGGEAIVHFEEWDLEIELDKNMSFTMSDVTECDDQGCSGVSDIYGEITFKKINGKLVPHALITMSFYRDLSDDVDCDVVDCDHMDYEDYWKEWDEAFEYKYFGAIPGQMPAFKPAKISTRAQEIMTKCNKLTSSRDFKCTEMQKFVFDNEITPKGVEDLINFLDGNHKIEMTKETAIKLVKMHFENELFLLKTFTFKGEKTEAYTEIENNFKVTLSMIARTGATLVLAQNQENRWSRDRTLDFLFVNKKLNKVIRYKIKK